MKIKNAIILFVLGELLLGFGIYRTIKVNLPDTPKCEQVSTPTLPTKPTGEVEDD